MAAKEGLAARCLSHRGMDSSFAGLGAARGWHWSGRFITSACATMLIVAAGVLFSGSENARQQIAMGYGCHCKLLQPLRRTRWTESQA